MNKVILSRAVTALALVLCACSGPGQGRPVNTEVDEIDEEPETAAASEPDEPEPPTTPKRVARPGQPVKPAPKKDAYTCTISSLPPAVVQKVKQHSWRKGCPVELDDLAYMRIAHRGYDGEVHLGELIAHKAYAAGLEQVFAELFARKFPIQRMRLVDEYQGDDDRSMQANNTSAFNCRPMTGYKKKFSKHAYGGAVDINPLHNPYYRKRGDVVQPAEGRPFVNRRKDQQGMIKKGDACHKSFEKHGWRWGGLWRSVKDYQHFEIHDIKGTWRRNKTISGTVDGVSGTGRISVFTPRGYSRTRKDPFRLLVALHGWRGRAADWEKRSRITYWANKYQYVVVAPDMGTSVYERAYYPETRARFKWGKIPGGRWVGEVVLPHMRKHYNVYKTRNKTGVFGLSTGGRGAALLPVYYRQFRAFAALSGDYDITLQPKERTCTYIYGPYAKFPGRWRRDNSKYLLDKYRDVAAYLVHGVKDSLCPVKQSQLFYRDLKSKGFDVTAEFPPKLGHSWYVWDGYLGQTFEFFNKKLR